MNLAFPRAVLSSTGAVLAALLMLTVAATGRELAEADKARPVIIASDPWCPYACDPDADGREGYMVEMAREIFEAAGLRVEYRLVNFAMLKRMAREGTATAIPGVASTMDGAVLLPALAQGNSANAVAMRRGVDFSYAKPEDFARFRLGVIKDYDYGGVVQEYIDRHQADPARVVVLSGFGYSHLVQGLRQMMANRLDLLLDDRNVLRWQIRRLAMEAQVTTSSLGDDADLFVGLSRSDPRAEALARLLAEGTRRLRENGRMQAILRQYGLDEVALATH